MTDTDEEKAYWDISDAFIDLANKKGESNNIDLVNDAMMFSTARYNAFLCTNIAKDISKEKQELIHEYVEHYRKMLSDNIDEMINAPSEH